MGEGIEYKAEGFKTVADFVRWFNKLDRKLPNYNFLIAALNNNNISAEAFVENTEAWLSNFTEPEDFTELNELTQALAYARTDEEKREAAKALAVKIASKQ